MRESCTEFRQFLRRERCVAREKKKEDTLASIAIFSDFASSRESSSCLFFFSRDTFLQQLALKMRVNISLHLSYVNVVTFSRCHLQRRGDASVAVSTGKNANNILSLPREERENKILRTHNARVLQRNPPPQGGVKISGKLTFVTKNYCYYR